MKTLILLFSVLFTTMSFSQVPSYVPANGLVGWWPFNGNANDESGNGNNGTVNGATLTADRNGNSNSAYLFNGTSNNIGLSQPFLGGVQVNSFSFFTRFKSIGSPGNGSGYNIWGKTFYWGEFNFGIAPNNTIYIVWANSNGGNTYTHVETNTSITPNTWVDAVITFENSQVKIYFNGVLQSITDYYGTNSLANFAQDANPSLIGDGGVSGHFNGIIDDFGVWNRALTQQEITNLYTSTVPPTTAVLSGDATICAGSSTNLSVVVTGGTAPYSVTVTDGTNNYTATGASPVSIAVSPTATSSYTIVSVTGGGTGTGNTGTATVIVTPIPTATITAATETTFCNGGSVVLYASGGTSYIWSNGSTSVGTSSTYTASTTGSYIVIATDVNGCTATSAATVLTISPSSTNSTNITACGTYTWANNGQTYTTSGVYTGTTTNCVTETLNLTIIPATVQPTLACYETATFNTTTCSWVISGPQAPQKMSYQAIIRNSNDSLLISTSVGMRISLVQGAPSGTVVFSETQTATTNANGLVSLQIGMGTAVTGAFACIDWAAGPYYVKTETDLNGGINYTIISSNELLSVPYALFSANGTPGPAGPQGPIGLTGANGPTGPQGTFPPGTVAGEMNYWNGTAWVTVAPGLSLPGNQALTLSLCNGVPTWGPCPAVLPTVITVALLNINNFSASSGGAVTNDGGGTVTAWGVCWSTSSNPTLANSFLQNNVSSGSYGSTLSGLTQNTTYYVRAYATNSTGTAYGNEQIFTTTNTSDVGLSFQGGIVAYILQPGDPGYDANVQHGLIAAPSDLGVAPWGCQGTEISGADGTAIGTGAQNTIDIMTGCSTAGIAASLCGDLVLGGYSDWYLPSKDELNKLYINRVAIGGFAVNYYWSSTEDNSVGAWIQGFGIGNPNLSYKVYDGNVRAVRAF